MVAFTSVIHAIGNDGDVRSCLKLFERAREEGMTPDLTMYSTLVNVLLTNDEVEAAQKARGLRRGRGRLAVIPG